jgi:hypothetical protein
MLPFGLLARKGGQHRRRVDGEVGRDHPAVADRPAVDLGDVERGAGRPGRASGTAELVDHPVGFEDGVDRHCRVDGPHQPEGEVGEAVVALVAAPPWQALVLGDHDRRVQQVEQGHQVLGRHGPVDPLDDPDVGL